ncbi:response regulator [Paenibacillus bouchesdurhonensis]|uniref:response regulator n=1 Tax=Paenibacillus bouchesdurhonensis TaxID=1870990 RepID=UPI0019004C48|nr:response regulator [Paenibacillus bouchesdurhonensis]
MPKILIVDDEKIFRKGLRAMITSLDPEWEVVGDASDGYEALDRAEVLQPDVILTDIRMPRMDGIALQRVVKERFPQIECVVVSGYEDFTYALQSMRYGAKDYLMKPVERSELGRILGKLKEETAKRGSSSAARFDREENELIRRHVSESVIAGLMRGKVQQHHVDLLRKIGVDFDQPYYCCLLIKLDKGSIGSERYLKADPSLFQLYIRQFVQEMVNRRMKGYSLVLSDSEVAAIVNLNSNDSLELIELAESIRRQITSLSNLTVTIGVGRMAEGVNSISDSYRDAEISLLYRLIVGGDKVLHYDAIRRDHDLYLEVDTESWGEMERAVLEGRAEEAARHVESEIGRLCRQATSPELIYQKICKLLIHFYEAAEKLNLTKAWLSERDIRSLIFDVCSITSSEELMIECRMLLTGLAGCIAESRLEIEHDPVDQALQYLDSNFHKPITLNEVAGQVHLNPAYFSSLFKQRTGTTFVERLTAIRIEEAKRRLMDTDDIIAAIAEETGFPNLRHFYRVFKREAKLSPKDYRRRFRTGMPDQQCSDHG